MGQDLIERHRRGRWPQTGFTPYSYMGATDDPAPGPAPGLPVLVGLEVTEADCVAFTQKARTTGILIGVAIGALGGYLLWGSKRR